MMIWYPTYEGAVLDAPLLKLCAVRWPIVLFLHGVPPLGCDASDYYRWWIDFPGTLARSGYVVVVPNYTATLPQEDRPANAVFILRILDWVRDEWEEAEWLDRRPGAIAVAGHSYGGLLAARICQMRPEVSAYVGFGAVWAELPDPTLLLHSIGAPSFYMWGEGHGLGGAYENLDALGLWEALPRPKYAAVYRGEHFDYLRPRRECDLERGPCPYIPQHAADLATLFIARYMPVPLSSTRVPADLDARPVRLTRLQQSYAGSDLPGLRDLGRGEDCRITLRWVLDGVDGSRTYNG